ncbi:glycosyltransferase family 4 protein [Pseudoxanthomonas gei]|uniref:glycosyltransferase family 4 protein n=1 Tax=Pseudoxanthomonas gei TaxID=1383030 RepID=UPI001FE8B272|nr:glycosyltransferase family 1 protein [Pseudoxanthomonas gei]
MRIAYDLQACMTDSRDRGIGRYSENLVGAMVRMAGSRGSESQIALDGTDPSRLQDARSRLRRQRIAAPTVVYTYPSSAVTDLEPARVAAAATLRGRFFEALGPDVVVQTTHFEAGTNYATDLRWSRPSAMPSAVIAYDLIPLVFPERYMPAGSFVSQWYPRKCDSFRKFDLFLAISQATRDDLMHYLDIPSERIHVIGAGLDESLLAASVSGVRFHYEILARLEIREPFVLMVGNGDWRKNTLGTLEAFAALPRHLRDHHLLVLTQVGDDVNQALAGRLRHIATRVRILGKVDDDTLATLYHRCAVFFFPSLYEGFGLPVLEAMAFGAPVISSNLGSLPEVVHDPRCLFDPRDEEATVAILAASLDQPAFREVLTHGAIEHARTFTWDRCAGEAFDALSDLAGSATTTPVACGPQKLPVTQTDIDTWSDLLWASPADLGALESSLRTSAAKGRRRILVDISEVIRMDARSGIQRVVRNFCTGLQALAAEQDFELHPFCWSEGGGIHHADAFAHARLGLPERASGDAPVVAQANDLVFMLDSSWWSPERFDALHADVHRQGGEVVWMVYDLIPMLFPETCHPGMPPSYAHWLAHAIASADGFVCISEATRADLEAFMDRHGGFERRPWTRSVHLGSDLESGQVGAAAEDTVRITQSLAGVPTLLCIGTMEPRKDYASVLASFEQLWKAGIDCALVIVGKQGWNVDALAVRLRQHPQAGRRLFWLEGLEDGDIDHLLQHAAALVQASISEGYGLPIVEAGSKGVPLLLSDIAVFREIAGDAASYFPVGDHQALAGLIRDGLKDGFLRPGQGSIVTRTWREVSIDLVARLLA